MSENLLGRWHAKRVKNLDTYCPAFIWILSMETPINCIFMADCSYGLC